MENQIRMKNNFYKCLLGIPMKFKMPQSPIDDEWGFLKKDCKRFEQKPESPGSGN